MNRLARVLQIEENHAVGGGLRLHGAFASGTAEQPLVSVITAVFNARSTIASCITSVLKQDYPAIEHIVIDGGSSDGTIEILRGFESQIALWRSEPDNGVYDAWNKGLREARGQWICFLGSDDELLPSAVSSYMSFAAQHPEAEYISSKVRWVHPSGYVNPDHGREWSWKRFSKRMCVAHVGSMHRRSLFERLGKFDTSYKTAADYELLLRAGENLTTAFMPQLTAIMRAGGMSDQPTAVREAARAKIISGGRSALAANLEMCVDGVRFQLLPWRRRFQMLRRKYNGR